MSFLQLINRYKHPREVGLGHGDVTFETGNYRAPTRMQLGEEGPSVELCKSFFCLLTQRTTKERCTPAQKRMDVRLVSTASSAGAAAVVRTQRSCGRYPKHA